MSHECMVQVRFYRPPDELSSFFTTFYFVEMSLASGGRVADYLHPEWANLRFYSGSTPEADRADGSMLCGSAFAATGPSCRAVRFRMGSARMWGIGLLPLGWAKFVGTPAHELADAVVDGRTHPAFERFVPLADSLFSGPPDEPAELERIVTYFRGCHTTSVPDEARIVAIHAALIDPEVSTVRDLVARSGIGQRTLERICDRAFGFGPKQLLRRQRFMRSLSHYMLDSSLKWIGVMDGHYHDQAQFVRDFRQFMGMSPREYAAMEKPVIGAITQERARFALAAVQALDGPGAGLIAKPSVRS